jgi:hypothetical protein
MAIAVVKKILQGIGKQVKKLKPKKKWSKKNVGIGKIKDQKLYKTLGKDKYGDIQIINKGPQKGYRVPLDKKGFTERRPWASDKSYKASYGERIPGSQSGATVEKQMKQFTKKAHGGLIKGFPKIAKKGWR